MDDHAEIAELQRRVERIEQYLGQEHAAGHLQVGPHPAWPLVIGTAAISFGLLGVGYPRHYYPVLFSILMLLLLYHRGFLVLNNGHWKWLLVFVNFALLCLLLQCLIGGGISHPFDWVKLPAMTSAPPPADKPWYSGMVPNYSVEWRAIPVLAGWSIDVTKIQVFLLLAVLAGALFRFEPFTSVAALALLLVSIPSYLRFDWDWIVPFLIATSVAIYLQAGVPHKRHRL